MFLRRQSVPVSVSVSWAELFGAEIAAEITDGLHITVRVQDSVAEWVIPAPVCHEQLPETVARSVERHTGIAVTEWSDLAIVDDPGRDDRFFASMTSTAVEGL
jgi:hypothetical protein